MKDGTRSEQTLIVLLAQSGDRAALEQLLHDIYPPLRRYIIGLAGVTLADDVLQETSIQILPQAPVPARTRRLSARGAFA